MPLIKNRCKFQDSSLSLIKSKWTNWKEMILLQNFSPLYLSRALVAQVRGSDKHLCSLKTLSCISTGIYEDCSAARWPSSAGSVLTKLCRHSPLQAWRWCKGPLFVHACCVWQSDFIFDLYIHTLSISFVRWTLFLISLHPSRKHSLATSLHWVSWLRSEIVSDKHMSTLELQSVG